MSRVNGFAPKPWVKYIDTRTVIKDFSEDEFLGKRVKIQVNKQPQSREAWPYAGMILEAVTCKVVPVWCGYGVPNFTADNGVRFQRGYDCEVIEILGATHDQ